MRTVWAGFHQTLCEVSYVGNSRGAAVGQDRRSRLGSRLRERRRLVELIVRWHDTGIFHAEQGI